MFLLWGCSHSAITFLITPQQNFQIYCIPAINQSQNLWDLLFAFPIFYSFYFMFVNMKTKWKYDNTVISWNYNFRAFKRSRVCKWQQKEIIHHETRHETPASYYSGISWGRSYGTCTSIYQGSWQWIRKNEFQKIL